VASFKLDDRFARHRLIEGFSQDIVASLHIAVIGAGAIGNELVKNLMLLGIGAIDVYDFDTVELSNLTRSVFLRESDLGRNKAEALVARAQELYSNTHLSAIAGDIGHTLSLTKLADYDFVMVAVDNLEARLRINDMALIMRVDWLNLAIDARQAVVELFPFRTADQACYACSLPNSAFEKMAARYSCGGLQRAHWLERKVPTTTVTASAVASLACSEMLRFAHLRQQHAEPEHLQLFGLRPKAASQRVYLDTITPTISRTFMRKAGPERGCPGCALHFPATSFTRSTQISLFKELKKIAQSESSALEELQLNLSDSIILSCVCSHCGANSSDTPALTKLKGSRSRDQKDTITQCPSCEQVAVAFNIVESLSLQEFESHFAERPPRCAWITVNQHCIDLLTDQPTAR
jgi:molybdopterin-synthase adenylyltransferase